MERCCRVRLLLQVICAKYFGAGELHDGGAFLRCDEMREAGWNHDKTARWVGLELSRVVFSSDADIPGTVDNRNLLVLRVRVGSDMVSRRYLHEIGRAHVRTPVTFLY